MRISYRKRGSPWGCSAQGWLWLLGALLAVGLIFQVASWLLQFWWLVLLIGAFVLTAVFIVKLWRQP